VVGKTAGAAVRRSSCI